MISQDIASAPLYFVRGGFVRPGSKYLTNAGSGGDYWSSTPYSSNTHAYHLYFYDTSADPSLSNARYSGLSLRCLAR